MTLWLVPVMPTRLPAFRSVRTIRAPGIRLARARRALDRERRVIERQREPPRRVEVRLAVRRTGPRRSTGRRAAASPNRRSRPARFGPSPRCRGRRPTRRCSNSEAWWSLVRDPVEGDDRARMRFARRYAGGRRCGWRRRPSASSPTIQLNGVSSGPSLLVGRIVDTRRARGRSPARGNAYRQTCLPVPRRRPAGRSGSSRPIGSSSSTSCSGVRSMQPVEVPPHRLVLATVPAEELAEQPGGLLLGGRCRRGRSGDLGPGQSQRQGAGRAPRLGQVGGELRVDAGDRSRHFLAGGRRRARRGGPRASRAAAGC